MTVPPQLRQLLYAAAVSPCCSRLFTLKIARRDLDRAFDHASVFLDAVFQRAETMGNLRKGLVPVIGVGGGVGGARRP